MHKLLRISSRDRDIAGSSSTSDFVVNFNNADSLQSVKSVVVKSITFPNVMYNIHDNNRSFTYNIASTPTTVQIAAGQYTLTTLITALEAAASAIVLAVTQDAITQKLSFTTTTAVEFLDITENPMAEVLGIEYGAGSGSDVTSFNATGLPSLEGESNIFVESKAIAESNLVRSDGKIIPTVAVVPITVGFADINHYITGHSEIDDIKYLSQKHGKNIQKIDIRLLDHDNNVIDLHGHHVTIIMKLYT